MKLRKMRTRMLVAAALLGDAGAATAAAAQDTVVTAKPHVEMATAAGNLPGANARGAGSVEQIFIRFIGADGLAALDVPLSVKTSSTALLTVTPTAQPGVYTLAVPTNTTGGNATLIATAVVGGVTYMGGRNFSISGAAAGTTPSSTPTPTVPVATGTSTMIRSATPTLAADQSGCPTVSTYDVGPGKTYTALAQLPWSRLKGCDTVRIYPKVNNVPYYEMMLISAGTDLAPAAPNRFLRILGMPDPVTGILPIIDGTGATQLETLPGQAPRMLQYHDNASLSPILHRLGLVMVGPQQGYSYHGGPAGYISIENLELRNARYDQPYNDALTGLPGKFHSFATCLFVEAAAHLVIRGNILHDCSNGLFINSKNAAPEELSQDVLVDGNFFYNNGNAPTPGVTNGFSEHHSYTEARDIIFQYNYFGPVAPGSYGDCIKDRSSGLVVRYNTFASNCGIKFNLEDSTGGQALISGDSGYATTYIYGNLIDIPASYSGTQLVTYGGDSGQTSTYRQGTLYFYNNSMIVAGDSNSAYPDALLFFLVQPSARAEVWNNIFYAAPATPGHQPKAMAMVSAGAGTVNLSNNWMSARVAPTWLGHPSAAKVTGWAANIVASGSPGFQNQAPFPYTPAAGSALVNGGVSLASLKPGSAPLSLPQTQALGPHVARKQDGQIDIGAFEY
ncbi:hypothetical protein QH494_15125 [Sphingomonas sp. AR_OL41]|uniref:right-handed parallel beta-helix repeat-containing protein n=1 Tax=Sphingomonas sp. AR_OL41 TaxID=3042729 RepID=UPI002480A6FC|nr:hypothetical protein [Sphingomonas sp. AR_OL41]MDH7973522.1 hypothetical protein [Sphingomonas sp. AR_OL41]